MQSVGEVMAIGRTFRESIQKAFRSLEVGLIGFQPKKTNYRSLDISKISFPTAFRLLKIWDAFKEGYSIDELYESYQKGVLPKSKCIAITFDDGYDINSEYAAEILDGYSIPSIFYLNTYLLETSEYFWWDEYQLLLIFFAYKS